MAEIDKLRDTEVKAAGPTDKVYRLPDGGSLFLKVTPAGAKVWEFYYRLDGKNHTAVLGRYPELGLAAARKARDDVRHTTRTTGVDVVTVKNKTRAEAKAATAVAQAEFIRIRQETQDRRAKDRAAKLEDAKIAAGNKLTVAQLARLWTDHKTPAWSPERLRTVLSRLDHHLIPALGDKPITTVTMDDVLAVFATLTQAGMVETARFVRQSTGAMFEWAVTRNKLAKNPVMLAAPDLKDRFKRARKVYRPKSFPTIKPKELPALLRAMRTYEGTPTTRGLMWFLCLTTCRTGEARFMRWDDVDLDAGVVTLSAERMKMDKPHTIYLNPPAIALLRELKQANGHRPFVFAHPRRDDRPCSENAVLYALAEIGYKGRMTGHGFRHLCSTMANESGKFTKDVVEALLAHGDEDQVRGAYLTHAEYQDARRKLATWWAKTLADNEGANVVKLRRA